MRDKDNKANPKTHTQTQNSWYEHKSIWLKFYCGYYCHSSIQPSIDIHPSSIQTSIFIHPTIHCHPFIHPFSTQVFFALVVFVLCGVLHLQLQSFTFFFFSCFSCVSGGKEERERERERERGTWEEYKYLRGVVVKNLLFLPSSVCLSVCCCCFCHWTNKLQL